MKKTIDEYVELLETAEKTLEVEYEIGMRGGNYTITADKALELIGIGSNYFDEYLEFLPTRFGAGCNYLGGGLRGSIMTSGDAETFEAHGFKKQMAEELGKLAEACKQRYLELEGDMNDEESDGEINYEAIGTRQVREMGVERVY